jgi:hypothetical protein
VSSRYLSAAVRNELPTSRHGARGDTEPHLEPGRLRLGSTQPTVAIETNVMAQLVAAGMESGLPERECLRTVESGFSAGELNIQEIARETESATLER